MSKQHDLITHRINEKIRLERERHNLQMKELKIIHKQNIEYLQKEISVEKERQKTIELDIQRHLEMKELAITTIELLKIQKTLPTQEQIKFDPKIFAETLIEKMFEHDDIKEQLEKVNRG